MLSTVKMAWRNLWRNRRRTFITASSVFFGVVLATFTTSMQEGSYEHITTSIVEYYSGYIQIQDTAYFNEKTINHSFDYSVLDTSIIHNIKDLSFGSPRLESFALAAGGEQTQGVMVMGIAPETEDEITGIRAKIKMGKYLKQGDPSALISMGLADYLNLTVGDTLVMISQGYHGVNAAGIFPIKGIFKHPSPVLNNQMVLLDLATSQEFFSAPEKITSYVIMLNDHRKLDNVVQSVNALQFDGVSVRTWKELQPEMVQQIESDRASGAIMKFILYLLIGFGILGTVIMMMVERKRELAIMVAVGMQKRRLYFLLSLEALFIGLVGAVAGLIASFPLMLYFAYNPIPLTGQAAETMIKFGWEPYLMFSMSPSVFWHQALTIFILSILVALYPVFIIQKMKISSAMKA